MKLNPLRWLSAGKSSNQGGQIAASTRASQALGPFTEGVIGAWVPQAYNPWLFEALRDALGILDAGISRLVTLDGIVRVRGVNKKLVAEIEAWMNSVLVNDTELGLQAFYASMGDEMFEQGHAIGEPVFDDKARDVVGLRVADSKGVLYVRTDEALRVFYRAPGAASSARGDGLDAVEAILRRTTRVPAIDSLLSHGFVELAASQLVFAVNQPKAGNPYGSSMLASLEFVAQILLKMQNATGRVWERFGDPPFHVHYGTKNRTVDADTALKRARQMANNLAAAMAAKAKGNSVDLSTAAAADDVVEIKVIGAEGEALEIEMPARHMLEQVVAKFGLPAWMLGVQWAGASAQQAEQQSILVLQESKTRWTRRKPGLEKLVATMLRARGRTWKAGDWELWQDLPNLQDVMKMAQAQFLLSQARQVGGGGENDEALVGIDNNLRAARARGHKLGAGGCKASGDDEEPEPWAEADPELPLIERAAIQAILALWAALGAEVLRLLRLDEPGAEPFALPLEALAPTLAAGERFAIRVTAEGGPLTSGVWQAWRRGRANAAAELSIEAEIAAQHARVRAALQARGLTLVRNGVVRLLRTAILGELLSGAYDGMNPVNVARELKRRFDAGDYNWERLARSEIAMAQSEGKLQMYLENGVMQYDFVTAVDESVCPICHGLAAAGPYTIGAPEAPLPVRDSHPNCRCTIVAREPA